MIQIGARIALWDFWPRQLERRIKLVLIFFPDWGKKRINQIRHVTYEVVPKILPCEAISELLESTNKRRGGFRQVQKVCINLSNISDFLKQSIEINYQIHDYKNFRLSHVKLRKFLKKLKDSMLQVSLFQLHLSYIFAVPCDLYFLPPGWRTRLNSPHQPFSFCEFDFLEPSTNFLEPFVD